MTRTRRLYSLALALVTLTLLIRLPALVHPKAIDDEAMYSVVANEVLDGGRPYADAVERKPPLLFWTYAAIFGLAGEFNWPALHAAAAVWILLTMGGLYAIGRRLVDSETGLIAALLYSIFQPWGTWKNLALNGEMLMNLPIVLAWMIALAPRRRRRRQAVFFAGALIGAACLLKQPAAISGVPLPFYLALRNDPADRDLPRRDIAIEIGLLALGFIGTLSAAAAVLYGQGILRDAVYWTVLNHDVPRIFWMRALMHTLAFAGACMPMLLGAAMGAWGDESWLEHRAERVAIIAWLAVSAVGTVAGGRFYPHYYIQLVPPLALLAAPVYRRLWASAALPSPWLLRRSTVWGWLALTVVVFTCLHEAGLAVQRQPGAAGQFVLAHSSREDRIFVWGQAAPIYLDAHRRPASRYITSFPLTGFVFGSPSAPESDTHGRIVPGAWANLFADFARHPPAFILDAHNDPDVRYELKDFPLLARLVAERYHYVASTADAVVYEMNGHEQSATKNALPRPPG